MKIFFFYCTLFLVLYGIRGVVYSDEGYVLQGASRILSGEIPYKDFHFAYTPLVLYATSLSFFVFGKSVLAGRILMILMGLISLYLMLFITKKLTDRNWLQYLAGFTYIGWGPLHTHFPWPVMLAITSGLAVSFFLLQALDAKTKKKTNWYIIFAGVMVFITGMAKQNFGVFMLPVMLIAFFTHKKLCNKPAMIYGFLGIVIPALLYFSYLFLTGSLYPFWHDFYTYTLRRIVLEQTLTTPFFFGDTLWEKIGKFLFYASPFFLSISAVILDWKKKRYIFLSSFVLFFYLSGIRPTTDYIHLAPLLSLIGIPLIISYSALPKSIVQKGIGIVLIGFCFLGFYTALYKGYYRWQSPLFVQTDWVFLPKTYIFLDSYQKDELTRIVSSIQNHTKENEPIFVNGYAPMWYFLSDRKNPTDFDLLEPTDFYKPYEKELQDTLEKKRVPIILTRTMDTPVLGSYMKKEYNTITVINGWHILKRK